MRKRRGRGIIGQKANEWCAAVIARTQSATANEKPHLNCLLFSHTDALLPLSGFELSPPELLKLSHTSLLLKKEGSPQLRKQLIMSLLSGVALFRPNLDPLTCIFRYFTLYIPGFSHNIPLLLSLLWYTETTSY